MFFCICFHVLAKDVAVTGKMNLLHYAAKELAAATKADYEHKESMPEAMEVLRRAKEDK